MSQQIPGYTHGTSVVAKSPVSLTDFGLMQKSALFGEEDVKYLRLSHDVVKDQVEAILDVWYGFVGSQPHLLQSFLGKSDGKPLGDYLGGVRKRFGQWILDTARAEYDQKWLDYQPEIGLRHHRTKKNQTDGAASAAIVPFRDLFALIFPVTVTVKPFLAKKGHSAEDVEQMYAAWVKSCLLQMTLWSHPYVKAGDFKSGIESNSETFSSRPSLHSVRSGMYLFSFPRPCAARYSPAVDQGSSPHYS